VPFGSFARLQPFKVVATKFFSKYKRQLLTHGCHSFDGSSRNRAVRVGVLLDKSRYQYCEISRPVNRAIWNVA